MAIKSYETGTRFNPDVYAITLMEIDDEDDTSNNRFAIGIEIKMDDDVVKLQSPALDMTDFIPVTDFGFDNYDIG